jgi:hypothetical protein
MDSVDTTKASKISGHSIHMLHYYQRHSILRASISYGRRGIGRRYSRKVLTDSGMSISKLKGHVENLKDLDIDWASPSCDQLYFAYYGDRVEILSKEDLAMLVFENLESHITIVDLNNVNKVIEKKIKAN